MQVLFTSGVRSVIPGQYPIVGDPAHNEKVPFRVNFTLSEKLQVVCMTEISIVDDFQQVS